MKLVLCALGYYAVSYLAAWYINGTDFVREEFNIGWAIIIPIILADELLFQIKEARK